MKHLLYTSYYLILGIICLASCAGGVAMYGEYPAESGKISEEKEEDGRCYEKCTMPAKAATRYYHYNRYLGSRPYPKGVKARTIITKEKSSKWQKKKADRNCMSANPEDCMVWCLVDIPAEREVIVEVKDTASVSAYALDSVRIENILDKGGYTDLVEVVCKENRTPDFFRQLKRALGEKGYHISSTEDRELKKALCKFQKDYDYPVGTFDLETLAELGVTLRNESEIEND